MRFSLLFVSFPRWLDGLLITSALMMEAARFSESLASTNESTLQRNLKGYHQNHHQRENLKTHVVETDRRSIFLVIRLCMGRREEMSVKF
jgi:hypothetical protein